MQDKPGDNDNEQALEQFKSNVTKWDGRHQGNWAWNVKIVSRIIIDMFWTPKVYGQETSE